MHQFDLADQLYDEAQSRAAEAGYATVDEYIVDVVKRDSVETALCEAPNRDHLFTPERLEQIDEAEAEIRAGNCYTAAQAKAELAKRRAEWIRKNPR
jgi:hypothetical protein